MSRLLTVVVLGPMSLGILKMPFGLVSASSTIRRPREAPSSLLMIVYLPLSRAIVGDEQLRRLGEDDLGVGLLMSTM